MVKFPSLVKEIVQKATRFSQAKPPAVETEEEKKSRRQREFVAFGKEVHIDRAKETIKRIEAKMTRERQLKEAKEKERARKEFARELRAARKAAKPTPKRRTVKPKAPKLSKGVLVVRSKSGRSMLTRRKIKGAKPLRKR